MATGANQVISPGMAERTATDVYEALRHLVSDDRDFHWLLKHRPLLAHYTSIDTLEKIMRTEELWLSNPLFMNDLEEMRFGMFEGQRLFLESEEVRQAAGSEERAALLYHAFNYYFTSFANEHALDVYVFCLSQHDPEKTDGLLSMWRAYGAQGNGAALIFNTNFTTESVGSPLIFTRVQYASPEKRIGDLKQKLHEWCDVLKAAAVPDHLLSMASAQFFNAVKLFALTSKHRGFEEEREWRMIYMPDYDPKKLLARYFGYVVGKNGIEPKMKLPIRPEPLDPAADWTLANILERIILGPSVSTALTQQSVRRMLERCSKSELCARVFPSTIPLRPT